MVFVEALVMTLLLIFIVLFGCAFAWVFGFVVGHGVLAITGWGDPYVFGWIWAMLSLMTFASSLLMRDKDVR